MHSKCYFRNTVVGGFLQLRDKLDNYGLKLMINWSWSSELLFFSITFILITQVPVHDASHVFPCILYLPAFYTVMYVLDCLRGVLALPAAGVLSTVVDPSLYQSCAERLFFCCPSVPQPLLSTGMFFLSATLSTLLQGPGSYRRWELRLVYFKAKVTRLKITYYVLS